MTQTGNTAKARPSHMITKEAGLPLAVLIVGTWAMEQNPELTSLTNSNQTAQTLQASLSNLCLDMDSQHCIKTSVEIGIFLWSLINQNMLAAK